MASILYAYHNGEWKRGRFQSLGEARRIAYVGEQRGTLTPVRIDTENYYKGRTEVETNWKWGEDGPITRWLERYFPPEYVEKYFSAGIAEGDQ